MRPLGEVGSMERMPDFEPRAYEPWTISGYGDQKMGEKWMQNDADVT